MPGCSHCHQAPSLLIYPLSPLFTLRSSEGSVEVFCVEVFSNPAGQAIHMIILNSSALMVSSFSSIYFLLICLSSHLFKSVWTYVLDSNPVVLYFVVQSVLSLSSECASYWVLCLSVIHTFQNYGRINFHGLEPPTCGNLLWQL